MAKLRVLELKPQSVAEFYQRFMTALAELGLDSQDLDHPGRNPSIPFRSRRTTLTPLMTLKRSIVFGLSWRGWTQCSRNSGRVSSAKSSPVHFWWGSFDHAVTRFSGRVAPERPGADRITREAYSHEVSSAGFWPGGGDIKGPAFYSYAAPEPGGFAEAPVGPAAAFYHPQMKEFLLLYDDVRTAASPKDARDGLFANHVRRRCGAGEMGP